MHDEHLMHAHTRTLTRTHTHIPTHSDTHTHTHLTGGQGGSHNERAQRVPHKWQGTKGAPVTLLCEGCQFSAYFCGQSFSHGLQALVGLALCVRMNVHVCIYAYMCVHVCAYACMCVRVLICFCVCMCTCVGKRHGYNQHHLTLRSSTVRTPDLRTSWTPQRNSTKISATFSKEPPLLSTSSFWVWAAPSTTPTLWSLSRNWVSILKELRSLPPSSMCTLWTLLLNLSIPDVPYPVLLSTLIRSRFQANPATLLIPIDFLSFSRWRSFTALGTKVASFPWLMWGGVAFTACVHFSFFFFFPCKIALNLV